MQEQTQHSNKFLVSPSTLEVMPFLSDLLEKIDELVEECANANNADLDQIKRYVAGHVAKDDLNEFEGCIFDLGDKRNYSRDWHALMGLALSHRKRRRIDVETAAYANQLRLELHGDDPVRAKEVRDEMETRKRELLEKKMERIRKRDEAAKFKGSSVRLIQYNKDIEKLKLNMGYMYENYGSHIVTAIANEDPRKYLTYPAFTFGNSDTSRHAIEGLNDKLGFPLYYEMQTLFKNKVSRSEILEKKDKASLTKIFRKVALDSLKRSNPAVKNKMEWKKMFDSNDDYGSIHNWPESSDYEPKYSKDGKFILNGFSMRQLVYLIVAIEEGTIHFTCNEN